VTVLAFLRGLALVLTIVFSWLLTRLVPVVRDLWREQTAAVAARVSVLQAAPLPRSHRKPARVVRATVRAYRAVTQ
jgi:hypothetical protein